MVIVTSTAHDHSYFSRSDSEEGSTGSEKDWSVGWFEPHAPDFSCTDEVTGVEGEGEDENEDADAENSFAVLVPCYGGASKGFDHGLKEEEEKKKKKKKEHLCFAALDLPPEINTKLSSGTLSPEIFEILDTQLVAPLRTFILSSRLLTNAHDNAGIAITASEEEHHHEIFHFRPPISCLISDTFMPWTLDLARDMGIPRVEMWTASATAYIFGSSILPLISKGLLPFIEGPLSLSPSLCLSLPMSLHY